MFCEKRVCTYLRRSGTNLLKNKFEKEFKSSKHDLSSFSFCFLQAKDRRLRKVFLENIFAW